MFLTFNIYQYSANFKSQTKLLIHIFLLNDEIILKIHVFKLMIISLWGIIWKCIIIQSE